jgi:hypothetical protein
VAIALAAAACAPACSMGDLAFMPGVWRSESGETRGEERWSLADTNTLLGESWQAKGATLSFTEIVSIQVAQNGSVQMHLRHFDGAVNRAWEEKDTPMKFRLASCVAHSAVFGGLEGRSGERITCRRAGEQLEFVADFLRKGEPLRVEVRMQRSAESRD